MQADKPFSNSPKIGQEEQITTANRFVLFMDILGFKERVARNSHEDVLKVLQLLQKKIADSLKKRKDSGIEINIFSDSIILFSKDETSNSLISLSIIANDIIRTAINYGVPIKGALAKGKITCDQSKQLFFGQALIDAYQLQESTKYYGVLVHHSAEEDAKKLTDYFRNVNAYIEKGRVEHYELKWHQIQQDCERAEMLANLTKLRLSVSGEPRKYIDNTKCILNSK